MTEGVESNRFGEGLDAIGDVLEQVTDLATEVAESLSDGLSGFIEAINEALESIGQDSDWLDNFDDVEPSNVDHVSAQVTLGAIDSYIENHPEGTRADDVHEHLFDNLQERFQIVERGWDRQIYSIDCLSNDAEHHIGGREHSHRDPGDDNRVLRNLELFEAELGVTDIIGLHGQDYLSPLVDEYNEEITGGRGINYHDFTLHNFSQRDDDEERDETIRDNYDLFGTAHYLAHNAPGNVMTHCRHGRHRARTVWLVVRVVDNPPQLEFTSTYDGTPRYNDLSDTDRERLDQYIKDQMEAIGIPEEEFGYLREAGDLLGQVGDIALSEEYRGDILNASNGTTY